MRINIFFICIGACVVFFLALDYYSAIKVNKQIDELTKQAESLSLQLATLRNASVLDLDDLPDLAGPRMNPFNYTRHLVVICIGKEDKERVNELITKTFNSDMFSYMFFHYDNSTWEEYRWYNQLNVVAIRVRHKMKFWYLKRFLPPALASGFSHIIILDADVGLKFDPIKYLEVQDAFNIGLSQPTHNSTYSSAHPIVLYHEGKQIGRYTNFIECGPAVFLSTAAYNCIYDLVQPDLTSGWGLDIHWIAYMKDICGFTNTSAAVFDAFTLMHLTSIGTGTASSNAGYNKNVWLEMEAYTNRFAGLGIERHWGGEEGLNVPFGDRSCLNSKIGFTEPC